MSSSGLGLPSLERAYPIKRGRENIALIPIAHFKLFHGRFYMRPGSQTYDDQRPKHRLLFRRRRAPPAACVGSPWPVRMRCLCRAGSGRVGPGRAGSGRIGPQAHRLVLRSLMRTRLLCPRRAARSLADPGRFRPSQAGLRAGRFPFRRAGRAESATARAAWQLPPARWTNAGHRRR
jgi:hypothetical protein